MMRSVALFVAALSVALSACATPETVLKHPETGQVARCGGDRSGAMMGGMIGYSLQKDDAEKCVRDYQAQGFQMAN